MIGIAAVVLAFVVQADAVATELRDISSGGSSSQFHMCTLSGPNQQRADDFACNTELVWKNGNLGFVNPVPGNHVPQQVQFFVEGSFNCDLQSAPSNLTLSINKIPFATAPMPLYPLGCFCGNCGVVVKLMSATFTVGGLPNYRSGANSINVLQMSSPASICVSNVTLTFSYT